MADTIGRAALTLGGAFFFGAPGAVIGGILADILFPVKLPGQEGPRLSELEIQRSTVGAAIPIVYGTGKIAGNIIWSGGLIEEVSTEEQGGKGSFSGPSQTVTTYSYFVDLAIGLCDGEDGRPSKPQGIRRIWADADLIFDLSPQYPDETDEEFAARLATSEQTQEIMTIYPGNEDQLPSPLIESYEGVGAVPAYRGLYHVEFERLALDRYGNRIPNFRFELYTGTATPEDCSGYSAGHLEPWQYMLDGSVHDPRNPENDHFYAECISSLTVAGSSFTTAMADMNATLSGAPGSPNYICGAIPQSGDSIYIRGWAASSTPTQSQPCDGSPSLATDRVTVTMNLNTIRAYPFSCAENNSSDGYGCGGLWIELGALYNYRWYNAGDFSGFYVLTEDNVHPYSHGVPAAAWDDRGDCFPPGEGTVNKWAAFDQEICVRRRYDPRDGCSNSTPIAGAPGFCIVNGVVVRSTTWTRVTSGTFKSLSKYDQTGDFGSVTSYPVDPCLRSDDPDYNNQTFWEAAYNAALAAGTYGIDPGWTYGVEYPEVTAAHPTNYVGAIWQSSCTATTVDLACVGMGSIVEDICNRAGLRIDSDSQVDVTDLTTCPDGYVVTRQMSARDALVPLRSYGLWDCVESDGVLKFIERGHAIVATITADDLGVHEAGSEAPTSMETTRVQEKDLPRRIRLHYADLDNDHEPGEQDASRITTEATDEVDIELPISMTGDYAAQLAEIFLYEQWVGRNTYRFTLNNDWLALEPADCLEIPVDGNTERVRVISVDYSIGGIIRIEAIRDDDGSYVSTAIAGPREPSGGGGGIPSGLVCPSAMVLLDLPRLRDEDIDCGYYAAVYGLCDSWACAAIYRSSDGGATYGRIARTDRQATVGEIIGLTGVGSPANLENSPPDYDIVNTITVELFHGTLSSVTDDQILAGYNAAAVGVDGRWVIIQYKTAVQTTTNTWELSDILWGLRDTDGNLSSLVVTDTFVLLNDSALLRLPETRSNLGAEKFLKAVTCGEAIDDVEAQAFTTRCLSYRQDLIEEDPPDLDTSTAVSPNADCATGLIWDPIQEKYTGQQMLLQRLCDVLLDSSSNIGDHLIITNFDSSGWSFGFATPETGGGTGDTGTGGGAGFPNATYWTENDESADLPFSWRVVAGTNMEIDYQTPNVVELRSTANSTIPINTQAGDYTLVIGDAGYCIYRDTGSAATWTIPANGSVAFPIGTVIMFDNSDADTNITIAITTDTLVYTPGGATGSRTLLPGGRAIVHKRTSTSWKISGTGIY